MPNPIFLANDKYYTELTQAYNPGDTTIYLVTPPDLVPTLICVAKGTSNETVFSVTGKTTNSVTGVTRLKGANVELINQTPVTCLNNQEFINQYKTYLGISWRGTWADDVAYELQDGVEYDGSGYQAIQAGTNHLPTDTDYWQLVMSKGDTGSQGIQGEAGEEVMLQNSGTYIQWKYTEDVDWTNLIAIADLIGDTGASITSGAFVSNDLVFTKDDATTVTITNAKIDLKGEQGIQGNQGSPGTDGLGVPAGGNTGQVLKKTSNADNDTEWGSAGLDTLQVVLSNQVFN